MRHICISHLEKRNTRKATFTKLVNKAKTGIHVAMETKGSGVKVI